MDFPKHLRITISAERSVQLNSSAVVEKEIFDQTYFRLAGLFSQALGFSAQILTPADDEIGRELSNGSWTGIIGMIQRNEVDVAISGLSITPERSKAVKFSYPFQITRITFATRKEEYRPELTAFLGPLSFTVWLVIVFCLIIMPIMRTMLFDGKCRLKENVWIAYGTFLGQTVNIHRTKLADYVMMFCWIMAATILGYCYKAILLSFLTFPPSEDIRTIPQLANAVANGRYQCTTYPGTYIVDVLASSNEPNRKIIGQNLQKNNGSNDFFAVLNDTKSVMKPAFVGGEDHLRLLRAMHVVADDELVPALLAFPMRKDFCCSSDLDRIIGYIWASGLYRKIIGDEEFITSLKYLLQAPGNLQKDTERQLSVEDLKGVFITLILGYALSITTFVLEVAIHIFKKR